jgi:hypothetical protein
VFKEAWFHNGHPVFVASNVLEDRFGEFLVQRRMLTRDQLERVLAVLERFNGRMGQALVSLGLIDPVDAVRMLAAQVASKLVTACTWQEGTYEVRNGEQNPWPALTLELSTYGIVSKTLSTLPVERLVSWAARVADQRAELEADKLQAFELDSTAAHRLTEIGEGRATLRQTIDSIASPAERLHVTAVAFVLARCGVLRLR